MLRIKSLTILGALLAATALASCAGTSPSAGWTEVEAPKENTVRWTRTEHAMRFAAGDANLSVGERDRLDAFLGVIRPDLNDRVTIGLDENAPNMQRAEMIRGELLKRNIAPRQIDIQPVRGLGADGAQVIVGRYVVIPPPCPNFSKPASSDYLNRPSSNFGCTTATNLGAMIANPGDLVAGRSLGPADANVVGGAVDRYRNDQIKKLPTEFTREIGDKAAKGQDDN
jgi:pilus assembly protein CpaD